MGNETTRTLHVSGWHCGGCSGATEGAVKRVPGVQSAKADLEKGTLTVTFDAGATSPGAVERAVEKAGYKVVPG